MPNETGVVITLVMASPRSGRRSPLVGCRDSLLITSFIVSVSKIANSSSTHYGRSVNLAELVRIQDIHMPAAGPTGPQAERVRPDGGAT